jgi:hypothetical protein
VTVKGSAGKSGNVYVLVYSINTDGADFRAIVTGAMGDYGPAVSVYPNGKADTSHSNQLELQLTHGSLMTSTGGFGGDSERCTVEMPVRSNCEGG